MIYNVSEALSRQCQDYLNRARFTGLKPGPRQDLLDTLMNDQDHIFGPTIRKPLVENLLDAMFNYLYL